MKKISLLFTTALSVLAFSACQHKSGSVGAADSANAAKTQDTTAMKPHIATDPNDTKFAVTAAADGMAEVTLGKLAVTKATNTHIKNFAQMMVTDHTKAGNELARIAQKEGITLPAAPDTTDKKKGSDLMKKSGKDFDKAYVADMVDGHEKAVKLFTDASKDLKDSTLKAFANQTLPTLKMHLDSIKAIKASMK
jgi:putative membrane protein